MRSLTLYNDVEFFHPRRRARTVAASLAQTTDKASARATVDTIDLQGVVVGSRTGSANFVRIPFEPFE